MINIDFVANTAPLTLVTQGARKLVFDLAAMSDKVESVQVTCREGETQQKFIITLGCDKGLITEAVSIESNPAETEVMNQRFTVDSKTVRDSQTGLIWDQETLPKMSCLEALIKVNELNRDNYKGHSDWRVPTIRELLSIVDFDHSSPACDPVFHAKNSWYWASTPYTPDPAYVWIVSFYNGCTGADEQTYDVFVRLVRSGQ